MAIPMKKLVLALGAAAVLGGCATGYHDDGYYGDRYAYGPNYYYDPYPGYVAPSVGLGLGYTYYEGRDRRHWRGDRNEWRHRDREVARIDPPVHGEPARNPDGTIQSQRLGTDNRGTTYWQGSDGRVYEGTMAPGKNPTASGG